MAAARRSLLLLLFVALALSSTATLPRTAAAQGGGLPRGTGRVGDSVSVRTSWGATVHARQAAEPGPTVVVFAADGPPRHAADQAWDWPLTCGQLVVVTGGPAEPPASAEGDLHVLLSDLKPAWVLDLRDSPAVAAATFRLADAAPADVAQRVLAERLAARVNAPIEERARRYTLAGDVPRATLLSRTAAGRLAVPTLTVVSMGTSPKTRKTLAVSLRTRHHRLLLHEALSRLGMLHAKVVKVDDIAPLRDQTARLRVAMYDGPGAAGTGPYKMEAQCSAQPDILFRRVGATEVQNGALQNFDVLIQPGGSSRLQGSTLGTKGRAAVQRFLAGGGGYVGVCAGAYLASGSYDRSLKILDAQVVDKKNSYRGRADLWMEVTPLGREVLGELGGRRFVQVRYHNGPVLAPAGKETVPNFEPLAVYRTEITKKRAKRGLMVGTPAIAAGRYGAGRVVTISPHPEQTAGLEEIVPRCARWVSGRSPEPPGESGGG